MPIECRRSTTGGKGNRGMFIERDPKIVAAGVPTAQQDEIVADSLQYYRLKDEVDALISDAIIPVTKTRSLPPLRKPMPLDMRFAGPFGQLGKLINPPNKTKFQTLVDDIKDTSYKSYWKSVLGQVPDSVPMLPEGFDKQGTTFGKATPFHGRLYDIVMPKESYPDKTPQSKEPAAQTDRKYCSPPYESNLTYGHRTFVDKRGTYARCCLTNDRIVLGNGNKVIINSIQANFNDVKQPRVGKVLAPNNNISEVPKGYTFGKLNKPDSLVECMTFCEMNKGVDFFRKCLKHLNTLRRGLCKRFLPTFFQHFYLAIKFYDTEKTGWVAKEFVYTQCGLNLIRFDPALIEPLLSMWQAFDGSKIEYKIFVRIINYREPSPEIPKILDFETDCLDYCTTYREMVKPGQAVDNLPMAGVPSGRYFDLDYPIAPEGCCAADKICLPQESDMKSCISPSIMTKLFVNHRDMYEKQTTANIKRVFEAAGEKFSDERFNFLWEKAKKLHSQGWVCYETFRQTLKKYPAAENETR